LVALLASRRFERTDIEWSNLAPAADERAKRRAAR
jgi:hypothetical protein